jgi:hypothetical protein
MVSRSPRRYEARRAPICSIRHATTVLDKAVAPAIAPHERWTGILRGSGFSPEVAAAFVAMYDGINAGIVSPQSGMERRHGKSALAEAARNLVQAT